MAYSVEFNLQTILSQVLALSFTADSLSLFDALSNSSTTITKNLMVDIQTVR